MTRLSLDVPDELVDLLVDRVLERLDERASAPAADEWVRGAQAAAGYLGCPRSRIYDLVASKKLAPRRDGRILYFRRSEFDGSIEHGG